jgi:hypothetical protein
VPFVRGVVPKSFSTFVDEVAKDAANEVFGIRQSVKDVLDTGI